MPIQEALVLSLADLPAPSGVSFGPPCASKDADQDAWTKLLPGLAAQMGQGRSIMALIQTRSTRAWSATAKNYDFKPAEDYLVAAYSLSPKLGSPYVPGSCSRHWINNAYVSQQGQAPDNGTIDQFLVFQCSPQGCKLSFNGVMQLTKFNMKSGAPQVQASTAAMDSITDAAKFGWRGSFPTRWVSASVPRGWKSAKPTGMT